MRTVLSFLGGHAAALLLALPLVGVARPAVAAAAEAPWLRAGPVALAASGPDRLEVGVGAFEPFDDDPTLQGSLEYRFGSKLAFIGPALGLLANTDGGVYGYLGFYLEVAAGPVRLTPMLAAGGYREGSSVDLGGVFQFRQSVALAWEFDNGHRLGLKVAHISNADIQASNPGAEDLMVTYTLPLARAF